MCCSVSQCVAVCCSVLQRVAACCRLLQCAVVCCSVLQCAAVRCSMSVQSLSPTYITASPLMLTCSMHDEDSYIILDSYTQCCSTLQCVAVYCIVLQSVAQSTAKCVQKKKSTQRHELACAESPVSALCAPICMGAYMHVGLCVGVSQERGAVCHACKYKRSCI